MSISYMGVKDCSPCKGDYMPWPPTIMDIKPGMENHMEKNMEHEV